MINYKTGEIILGDIVISPSLSRASFEAASVFSNAKKLSSNEPWVSYGVRFEQGDVSLDFQGEKLSSIMIGFYLPDENTQGSWESWSQENEKKRKQLHDQILKEEIGSTSRTFSWGKVGSIVDPKTCDASIFIQYE